MPIFYNKVQRSVNPGDAESEKKWYPVAKSIKRATEKEIAKYIARETTLNPKEAEMAIDLLGEATEFYLKHGYTVSLGDWASFNVTLSAEGADEEKDCGPAKIKKVVPHCRFSKGFTSNMQLGNEFMIGTSMDSKRTTGASSSGGSGSSSGGDDDGITE